jgi:hypothetical protein
MGSKESTQVGIHIFSAFSYLKFEFVEPQKLKLLILCEFRPKSPGDPRGGGQVAAGHGLQRADAGVGSHFSAVSLEV